MKISRKTWGCFILAGALCVYAWCKLAYNRFIPVNLAIDRKYAISAAKKYLAVRDINTKDYIESVVFESDIWADRYLQKTIGIEAEDKFIKEHNYSLFAWKVRLFKQLDKEEYLLYIDSLSGQIISFAHLIPDTQARPVEDKDYARKKAEDFLADTYGINFQEYDFHEEKVQRYDKRIDYTFSWEKKGVYIPWKDNQGGAKLLIGATISGDEVREFYKQDLDVPENFRRFLHRQLIFGEYVANLSFLLVLFLIIIAIYIVIKKRDAAVVYFCRKWYIAMAVVFVLINISALFNDMQQILMRYPTSATLGSFLGVNLLSLFINICFLGFSFLMPGLAAEALNKEVFPDKEGNSFLYYRRTSFYTRGVAGSIALGYFVFLLMLGIQAVMFYIGQQYLGVWQEWVRLAWFSSAYLPILSILVFAYNASLSEEIIFRGFGISLGKKYLNNTFLAVLVTSLVWGFAHSTYPVFPVWFRGIEVGMLGLFLGFIFVKYGIIVVLVAHFLFDAFWGTAAYLFGRSSAGLFYPAVFLMLMPLLLAVYCYLANRKNVVAEFSPALNKEQEYNLGILVNFLLIKKSEGLSATRIKEELIKHNWDAFLVDLAIGKVFNNKE